MRRVLCRFPEWVPDPDEEFSMHMRCDKCLLAVTALVVNGRWNREWLTPEVAMALAGP